MVEEVVHEQRSPSENLSDAASPYFLILSHTFLLFYIKKNTLFLREVLGFIVIGDKRELFDFVMAYLKNQAILPSRL